MSVAFNQSLPQLARRQKGSTLIEVLVALLVLGVGLLGMLGLQNQAIKLSQAALQDSQARYAINDLVERVRMNTRTDTANAQYYALSKASTASTATSCIGSNCSAQQLAAFDVSQWLGALTNTLPDAKAEVRYAQNTSELTVTVFYSIANLNQKATGTGVDGDPSVRQITVKTRIK
jgi:type IV pilus assembly protein PilV